MNDKQTNKRLTGAEIFAGSPHEDKLYKVRKAISLMMEKDPVILGLSEDLQKEITDRLSTYISFLSNSDVEGIDDLNSEEDFQYFDIGAVRRYLSSSKGWNTFADRGEATLQQFFSDFLYRTEFKQRIKWENDVAKSFRDDGADSDTFKQLLLRGGRLESLRSEPLYHYHCQKQKQAA